MSDVRGLHSGSLLANIGASLSAYGLFATARVLLACGALVTVPSVALAEEWPQKTVTIVAPFPAGGITDGLTRLMAEELRKTLNQTVVVENRAGASGSLGLTYVLSKPADGYTVVMGGNGPSAIVPSLNSNAKYAPKDFAPIAYVAGLPSVLVVHPSVPVKTLQEFVAYARINGDKLTCASHGQGSFNHLACAQFNRLTGSKLVHVPYKGAAPVVTDLLPGRIHAYFAVLPSVLGAIKAGQLTALATGEERRVTSIPDVPTLKEAGVPGLIVSSWNGLFVRTGTPDHIVRRLQSDAEKILKRPEVIARIEATGSTTRTMSAEMLGKLTQDEYDAYGRIGREENIQLQ